ncbi:MAG: BTAD domain-containing putative transcriptional regulator [Rubrivivax sp.]
MMDSMCAARTDQTPTLGKMRSPRLGRVIRRDRLFVALDEAESAPGLWIAGPAGFGKSTLVATYLQARGLRSGWLQLDSADVDPATFAHSLGESAGLIEPGKPLRLPLPTADDLRDVSAFVRRCFRRLALALDRPWVLVLDNVQELDGLPSLHAGIAAALGEMPEGSKLIAISREPPPAQYARALASQQMVTLQPGALRFTALETEALLDLHERRWSAQALCDATEGWAAGMILMLAARTELALPDARGAGGASQRLFDLFAGEVMAAFAPWKRHTLMRVAFMPSVTAPMAVAISGEPRAGELLEDLARRSLFTDSHRAAAPVYTFHALFGEFLRARATVELPADALQALRIEAARLLASAGQADAALAQLVQAEVWDDAMQLLSLHAGEFVAQGRSTIVSQAVSAMPDRWRSLPQALYWLGFCNLQTDPDAALGELQRAYVGFLADGDEQGAFQAAAAAADAIIFRGSNYDALAPWLPLLERLAPGYLSSRTPSQDLRVLPGLLAAFVHRDPGHALTAPLADAAEHMLDQPLGASQRILLGSLALYLLWTGQTARLDRILVKIDRMCDEQDAAPATLLRWYGVGVLVRSLLGRIDEAMDHARRALAISQGAPASMRVKAHLLVVLAAESARDAELARTHLTEAAGLLAAGNPVDVTTYEFQQGLLMLLDRNWHGAAQLMRLAVASGRNSGWPLREHIALIGQTLAATQIDSLDEAEVTLKAVFQHRFYDVCRWHHWIAALVEANLADRLGDVPRALSALRRGFAVGQSCGFDFGPLPYCCGDMMPRLLALALVHDVDTAFAQQMVRRHALRAPAGAPATWPWAVRIRTLGTFAIEIDGGATEVPRKESRKPLDLLKLLVALGGENVGVARLCAALWPEATGPAARNSFDNTLHRLRKLLGGEGRVTLRAGSLSLDAAMCWTDLGALTTCLASATGVEHDGDTDSLEACVDRVLDLYQGPFLAGDDELPDVLVARERLEARVTRQVAALGDRLDTRGQHAAAARLYQRLVEQQPLAEDIVRRLMACQLRLGQHAEAWTAYRRCRQQLSVVLGVRPAAETEAIANRLRNL